MPKRRRGPLTFEASRRARERASAALPGGITSNPRGVQQPWPLWFTGGRGPYLFDLDGNRLIDYALGNGPMLLGHSPAPVIAAVRRQLRRGLLYAAQSELEAEVAELLVEHVPCCRDGPVLPERHRGDPARAAARARGDRPRHGAQVPGPLPRLGRRDPVQHLADVARRAAGDPGSAERVPDPDDADEPRPALERGRRRARDGRGTTRRRWRPCSRVTGRSWRP